jgi:hypothetical protein
LPPNLLSHGRDAYVARVLVTPKPACQVFNKLADLRKMHEGFTTGCQPNLKQFNLL